MYETLLAVVAFSTNSLVAVWATLGPRLMAWRLAIVFAVAWTLGLLFSIGMLGQAGAEMPWWLRLSSSLVLLVPTLIVVA